MRLVILVSVLASGTTGIAREREFCASIGDGGTNFESRPADIELPLDPAETVMAVPHDSDSNCRVFAFEALYSDIGEFELIDDANSIDVTNEISSLTCGCSSMVEHQLPNRSG